MISSGSACTSAGIVVVHADALGFGVLAVTPGNWTLSSQCQVEVGPLVRGGLR